jgi:ATP-binding protein involved in chromosome partitioning
MKIAVPVSGGKATDFRHCEQFAIMDIDPISGTVVDRAMATPPEGKFSLLAGWLSAQGTNVVIAGDMIPQMMASLAASGIEVLLGAPARGAEELVNLYLNAVPRESVNI